jgi:guanine deaminase
MGEAYKVSQVHRRPLSPLRAWFLATLGGAQALYLDEFIGNFLPGKEADFIVLDAHASPELEFRLRNRDNLIETLFAMMILGDERCIHTTHILGERIHTRIC